VDIVVSDFDNTLFKRYHGLIEENVRRLEQSGYPIYIVTYRAENQQEFIAEQLAGTKLNIIGYGFAGSRNKDPLTKVAIIKDIMRRFNVVAVLDDDESVMLHLNKM
jgi:hydroxymethylpyrimidine pyrophosphatase-like HAD family hydrolase